MYQPSWKTTKFSKRNLFPEKRLYDLSRLSPTLSELYRIRNKEVYHKYLQAEIQKAAGPKMRRNESDNKQKANGESRSNLSDPIKCIPPSQENSLEHVHNTEELASKNSKNN